MLPEREPSTAGARILATLYLASGATGLCYEVLWSRMLTAQFGVSILGVAVTVIAFLLGLGLGSIFAARRPRATATASLRTFALLEGGVALYALALPAINAALGPQLEALAPQLGTGQWHLLQALLALLLLALPATAMGASFPIVLGAFAWTGQLLGRMYGLNCLGAAGGALLSLALLAALGWSAAVQAVAAAGLAIALAAALLARSTLRNSAPAQAAQMGEALVRLPRRGTLLAYAAVGACALMLEIAWTRLYGMVMLRTEYVLALILAVYLSGTALGSLLVARVRNLPALAAAVPLTACACTLAGLWALPAFSTWIQQRNFDSLASALAVQALALGLVTLPTTAALGAWLPTIARQSGSNGPQEAALLYGANCLGAAAGAALTVLVLIPMLGTTASIALAAVLILGLGFFLGAPRAQLLALPVALAFAWMLHAFPPPAQMMANASTVGQELYRYEDAVCLNHVTQQANGQRVLLTDLQHMDASSDPAAVQVQADQARLPLLLHPAPRSVLFLGLGTGISASGSLPFPHLERTAVEISPGASTAARTWFAPVNGGVTNFLRIEHDDARHFLAAGRQRYDVIVGDLFHPDLAGMGNLLSIEQFARARDRLAPGGIFTQWLALNQFDRPSLHAVLRGFAQVFPGAALFVDGMHLALVGAASGPLQADWMLAGHADMNAQQWDAATGEEGVYTWLGRYWGPIAAGIGPVQSEAQPVIEYRLPHLRYEEQSPLADVLLELLRQRPDLDTASRQISIGSAQRAAFANAYLANELAMQSYLAALAGDAAQSRQLTRLAYEANPRDHWIASAVADDLFDSAVQSGGLQRSALDQVLRIYPQHVEALRALWHQQRAAEPQQAARTLALLRKAAPLDGEAAASNADTHAQAPDGN